LKLQVVSPAKPGDVPRPAGRRLKDLAIPSTLRLKKKLKLDIIIIIVHCCTKTLGFQLVLVKSRDKMESSSSSALSDLINSSPLQLQTLVEFLRFRQLTSGGLVREVSKTLGDEITNFINGEKLPANISGEARATSEAEILDTPYFQFLWVQCDQNKVLFDLISGF
jgi:hypothetical protein